MTAADVLLIGGEDHALRIPFLIGLARRGFRVAAAGSCAPLPFERAGIAYRHFEFARFLDPRADFAAIRTIGRLIHDVGAPLVQCFDTKPNLLVPLAVGGVRTRVVRTINGLGWLYSSRSPVALGLRPIYLGLHRWAARSVAATIFQNRQDQDYFVTRGLLAGGRHCLIQGSGIDVDGFAAARAAGASQAACLRRQLGLDDKNVVVTVSRLTRQKGIPTLLEAAALVAKARPGTHFLLVGPRESEGPMAISEVELARHAAYVTALGPRPDIPSLLGMADVFAFPTEYREGVPRVLLEAALAEVPMVASNMPGCNDVVRDGWSGLLVEPRSPAALADGIVRQLTERRSARAMALNASDLVRRDFGLDTVLDRYAALYDDLIGRSCRSSDALMATEA